MHYLTVTLLLVAIMPALLGFTEIAGMTVSGALIAKGFFLIFSVLFGASLIADLFRWGPGNDLS